MTVLALDPAQLQEVRSILNAHLPANVTVRVFGSRVAGAVKRFSDLDLALQADEVLPLSIMAALAEAFDESVLPFKVDLIDRRALDDAFGAIVDATSQPLSR